MKNGSGLSPDEDLRWFKHLNPVFSEAKEITSLSSYAAGISIANKRNERHGESKGLSCSEGENPAEYSEDEIQIDRGTAPPAQKKE